MEEKKIELVEKKEEKGATAVEYALLVALIGVIIIGGATALGTSINTRLTNVAGNVAN